MARKILLLSILGISFFISASAQSTLPLDESVSEKKGFDPSRLFFGGNFGLTFGDFTFINVSPVVGYRLTDRFSVGTQVNFIYQSNKITYASNTYDKSEYAYVGLGVFGRFNPFKFVLLNVQPEMNYIWGSTKYVTNGVTYENKLDPKFVPSVLLGVGAAIPTGARGALVAMIQYDIVQNDLSPYGRNPFVSFGFNF